MLLSMEYIERILRENNLLEGAYCYFYGRVMPGLFQQASMGPALSVTQITDYALILRQNEIIMLPCNKFNNDIMPEKRVSLQTNNISKIIIKPGNPSYKKAVLLSNDNQIILEIQFQLTNLKESEKYKNNIIKFFNYFPTEGLELISESKIQKSGLGVKLCKLICNILMIGAIILGITTSGMDITNRIIFILVGIYSIYAINIKKK